MLKKATRKHGAHRRPNSNLNAYRKARGINKHGRHGNTHTQSRMGRHQ